MAYHSRHDSYFRLSDNGSNHFGEYVTLNIENRDWKIIVAEHNHELVGFCIGVIQNCPPVYECPRYGFVQDIAVTKNHRRKGIAKCLFDKINGWFKENGINRIELNISIKNSVSKKFWANMGFRDVMKRVVLDS